MYSLVNETTAVFGLIAVAITTVGLVWRKVVIPIRGFMRKLRDWMQRVEVMLTWQQAWSQRIEESIGLVEQHMKPDSGSTLMDKSVAAEVAAAAAEATAAEAAAAVKENADHIKAMDRKLNTLLEHDRKRDQPGLRYGPEGETP